MDEGRVPAPAVGAGDADAALEQVKRRLPAHPAAPGDVVGPAVRGAGSGVDHDDVERLEGVADSRQLGLDIGGGRDVAVGEVAEVELDAAAEAPLERHLIDGDRALAAVHRRVEVVGCIEMGAVVGHDAQALDRPAFAARASQQASARGRSGTTSAAVCR